MTTEWRVGHTQDITENDSDKTFSIPTDTEWEILWIWVEYTSSAVAGSRQLEIQFQDGGNTIAQWQTGIPQAENSTQKYLFAIGVPDLSALRDANYITTPLMASPFLIGGQTLRVWDNNAIDATGDDMLVQLEYGYHDVY